MLAQHPANLLLRFVLEVVALVAVGQWGWKAGETWPGLGRYALAFGLPLVMAALWGAFRYPEDSTQPGAKPPPVAIPGRARLALEGVFFLFALWATFAAGFTALGLAFLAALLLHHFWSVDRLVSLWRGRGKARI